MILLVTAQENITEAVTAAMPFPALVVSLPSVERARIWLQSQFPRLILLEAGSGDSLTAACRELRQAAAASDIPLIAMITQINERQSVLAAGADDYLFLPLLPAELKACFATHLQINLHSFSVLAEAFGEMYRGASPGDILDQAIEHLAQLFNAPSAWLLLANMDNGQVEVAGSYNLPPLLRATSPHLLKEISGCLTLMEQNPTPRMIHCPVLAKSTPKAAAGLTHHLSIPLQKEGRLAGVLNLAYPRPYPVSPPEQKLLALMGQHIGMLLDLYRLQQETQLHATQTAFIVLLARMLSERLDLPLILSLTMEQTVALLNASLGQIWLVSTDGEQLELASVLASLLLNAPQTGADAAARLMGQGLIGRVAQSGLPLCTTNPAGEAGFDPARDRFKGQADFAILAVPLRHHEQTIGVLAVYNPAANPFYSQDITLLEGIAGLAASAIANARLMEELRHYGEQQRGLYEMSQQIAAGLDLPSTLNRTLSWIGRLLNTEVSLLWLIDEARTQLELVSSLGVAPAQEQRLALPLAEEQSLCSWAVRYSQSIFINNPAEDTRINCQIVRQLGLDLHNALVAPISYNGQLIGVLSLLNKIGGSFTPADETLLTTAAEIVAVAISNARLHTQTIAFMAERERLHQQVLQSERLAIIGRLTASLSHEINNPMQAIQGALALALEEMNDAEALVTYITMSQRESERVVQLINRLRQIYRPATDPQPEPVSLNLLLKDAALMVRKELANQKVKFRPDLADNLPPVRAIIGQIHLVLLNLLLDLSQAIGQAGGGELAVRSYEWGQTVCLEFSTRLAFVTRLNWTWELSPGGGPPQPELGFDVPLSRDIIQAHGGAIRYATEGQRAIYTVELPIFQPMPTAAPTLPFPEKS